MRPGEGLAGFGGWKQDFLSGVLDGLEATGRRIQTNAKRKAPVRQVFPEKGRAKMVTRTFRNFETGATETATVRSHRANRYSTSAGKRQNFKVTSGSTPGAIALSQYSKRYVVFGEMGSLSARGRYEAGKMGRAYAANLESERNRTGNAGYRTVENWSPGTVYPKGTTRFKSGANAGKLSVPHTSRQTMLRVRATRTIRETLAAAAKTQKGMARSKRTYGGLNSRKFAAAIGRSISLYSDNLTYGSFRGMAFGKHYHLQLGGNLRDSIEYGVEDETTLKPRVEVGTNVKYAKPMEFGTKHNRAFPFLRPALYEERGKLQKDVARHARKGFG